MSLMHSKIQHPLTFLRPHHLTISNLTKGCSNPRWAAYLGETLVPLQLFYLSNSRSEIVKKKKKSLSNRSWRNPPCMWSDCRNVRFVKCTVKPLGTLKKDIITRAGVQNTVLKQTKWISEFMNKARLFTAERDGQTVWSKTLNENRKHNLMKGALNYKLYIYTFSSCLWLHLSIIVEN